MSPHQTPLENDPTPSQVIILEGNIIDGLNLYGPFNCPEEATYYAQTIGFLQWTLALLKAPE